MRRKILLRIVIGIVAIVLTVMLLIKVFVEPWIREKILSSLNNNSGDYQFKIEKVHVSFIQSGIELDNITLLSKPEQEGQHGLTGEIESVKFKGIHLLKVLFKGDIDIREVNIFNSRLTGKVAFPKKTKPIKVSPINVRIETCFLISWLLTSKAQQRHKLFH